jgi:hypothetical protein
VWEVCEGSLRKRWTMWSGKKLGKFFVDMKKLPKLTIVLSSTSYENFKARAS